MQNTEETRYMYIIWIGVECLDNPHWHESDKCKSLRKHARASGFWGQPANKFIPNSNSTHRQPFLSWRELFQEVKNESFGMRMRLPYCFIVLKVAKNSFETASGYPWGSNPANLTLIKNHQTDTASTTCKLSDLIPNLHSLSLQVDRNIHIFSTEKFVSLDGSQIVLCLRTRHRCPASVRSEAPSTKGNCSAGRRSSRAGRPLGYQD